MNTLCLKMSCDHFIDPNSSFFNMLSCCRLDSEVYDEGGNSLQSLDYDRDMEVRSPPSVADDFYSFYYSPEKRWLSPPLPTFLYPCWTSLIALVISVRVLCQSLQRVVEMSVFSFFQHDFYAPVPTRVPKGRRIKLAFFKRMDVNQFTRWGSKFHFCTTSRRHFEKNQYKII